jgi:hypothetical protein
VDRALFDSLRLRNQSRQLACRTTSVIGEIRQLTDELVLVRTDSQRLHEEARRLEELRRRLEANLYARRLFVESISFADCDVYEDTELLIGVNSAQLECGKCGNADRLVAVIQFKSLDQILALCGNCFQKLSELSLGAVV